MPPSRKALAVVVLGAAGAHGQVRLDPAAWGSNHVGKPIPEYVQGDECLFCHRNDIGPSWQKNRHGITVRMREDAPELSVGVSQQVEYFLGSRLLVRHLKKQAYGRLALLTREEKPVWDPDRFGDRCAGCHATAVNSSTKAFAAFGLDCYACHGVVPLDHTTDTSLAWLSRKRKDDSRAITSICAQCHLRGGKSRSTGLPYPNQFVAGDNLFQDFQVDFSRAEEKELNPGDRHVWRNVRDVVLDGQAAPTCLTCHQIHAQSSFRHRRLLRAPICWDCHREEGPFRAVKKYKVGSAVCEY